MRRYRAGIWMALTLALGAAALLPSPATAAHTFIAGFALNGIKSPASFEGACGVASDSAGDIYVADYYRNRVNVYRPKTLGEVQLLATISPVDALDGPCGLAVDSAGRLYVNDYHRRVLRFTPASYPPGLGTSYGLPETIDTANPTGLAIDPASDDLYVDDRTYVAKYQAPIEAGEEPAQRIGLGSLQEGYGVAVSDFPATDGYVYVPDAATDTVKVYDPATDPLAPIEAFDGQESPQAGFVSLRDSAATIEQANGHLYVIDNTQPGYEAPAAVVDELNAAGAYRGQLPHAITDAEPSAIAPYSGGLYVTSGNGPGSAVFAFGGSGGTESLFTPPAGLEPRGGVKTQGATTPGQGSTQGTRPSEASASEVTQRGKLRVTFDGKLSPHELPRKGAAPIRVSVATGVSSTDGSDPPQMKRISIAINRNGRFQTKGLPTCSLNDIQPTTTADALAACRSALVGQGSFEASVPGSGQSPFPSKGRLYAFNSVIGGHPAILAHVYGTKPVPTSFTLIFELRPSKGTFGTVLAAKLPTLATPDAYITAIALNLGRTYSSQGKRRSYLSAGCPAPEGFGGAVFPFAKASLEFAGGRGVSSTLTRSCGVRG